MDELEVAIEQLQAALAVLKAHPLTNEQLGAGGRQVMAIRRLNSEIGELIIAGLRADTPEQQVSWRDVERLTGIKQATARRWGDPPGEDAP